jgi:hypothetical protein
VGWTSIARVAKLNADGLRSDEPAFNAAYFVIVNLEEGARPDGLGTDSDQESTTFTYHWSGSKSNSDVIVCNHRTRKVKVAKTELEIDKGNVFVVVRGKDGKTTMRQTSSLGLQEEAAKLIEHVKAKFPKDAVLAKLRLWEPRTGDRPNRNDRDRAADLVQPLRQASY